MRKYDTYTPRPGNARTNQHEKSENAPVVFTHQQQKQVLPPLKPISQPSIRQDANIEQSRQLRPVKSSVSSSKLLAFRAVHNAQVSENDQFPDQMNTVYGVAKRKLSLLQKCMYGFGVLVLVFSLAVSIQSFINNKNAKDQIATLGANTTRDEQGVAEGTGDEPSEEAISNESILAYQVSNPEDPRYIRIPELKVFARIKNLGIDNKGAVDAPYNIYDAGWYNGSVRPGNKGSSLILGHVSGWTAPGIFKNLKNLNTGDQFEIEKGSGEKISYSVTRIEHVPVEQIDMAKVLSTEVAGEHDVKLMTCGGKYDRSTGSYTERTILYAKEM